LLLAIESIGTTWSVVVTFIELTPFPSLDGREDAQKTL